MGLHLDSVDRGRQQVVNQRIGGLDVRRILGDGVEVAPDLAAFLGQYIDELRHVALQLHRVARPAHAHPGIARDQRGLVVRVDAEEMRLRLDQQLLGIGQLLRVGSRRPGRCVP